MREPALLKYQDALRLKYRDGKPVVYDKVRKKYVVLTPEEFVRQLFIHFLTGEMKVSPKHIAVERQLKFNGKTFRFDILVFDKNGSPHLIVECKSYNVPLSGDTAYQIAKYNIQIQAPLLCITNGKDTLFFKIAAGGNPGPVALEEIKKCLNANIKK